MTRNAADSRVVYSGDGTTPTFAISKDGQPIWFRSDADIVVAEMVVATSVITDLVEGVDYSITGGPSAGILTRTAGNLPTGNLLCIMRRSAISQETDFDLSGDWNSSREIATDTFDRTIEIMQDVDDDVDRALKLDIFDIAYDAKMKRIMGVANGVSPSDVATLGQVGSGFADAAEASAIAAAGSAGSAAASASSAAGSAVAAAASAALAAGSLFGYTSRSAIAAIDTTQIKVAVLQEVRRDGLFLWKTGDYSALVTSDPGQGLYIASSSVASTGGCWVRQYGSSITPKFWGAVADGVTDDSAAFAAMMAFIRTDIAANTGGKGGGPAIKVDLTGKYACCNIDMTNMQAWNLSFEGGLIIANQAGKPIFDTVGSRGLTFRNIFFWSPSTVLAKCAIQSARSTVIPYCDVRTYDTVHAAGYWATAAVLIYGEESSLHSHCHYWNYNAAGRCAIFEGFDTFPVASDYATAMTGATSFINQTYDTCLFMYIPTPQTYTISGISKAASAVVTANGHAFQIGDKVVFYNIGGMIEMEDAVGTVSAVTTNAFTVNINSSAFTTFSGSGTASRAQGASSVYLSRAEGHKFINCYATSFGHYQLELAFPDATAAQISSCTFDFLFEGFGNPSHININGAVSPVTLKSCEFEIYDTHAYNALFRTNIAIADNVIFSGGEINVVNHSHKSNLALFDTPANYAWQGGDIYYPFMPTFGATFTGKFFDRSVNLPTIRNAHFDNSLNGAYTPASVTASSGTITTVGTKSGSKYVMDDWVDVFIRADTTTNGTGAGAIIITLPHQAAASGGPWFLYGKELAVGGKMLVGLINAGDTTVSVTNYDNTYPASNGASMRLNGRYRKA